MAQCNYAAQEYACGSNTMLNTHGSNIIGKIKHDNTFLLTSDIHL